MFLFFIFITFHYIWPQSNGVKNCVKKSFQFYMDSTVVKFDTIFDTIAGRRVKFNRSTAFDHSTAVESDTKGVTSGWSVNTRMWFLCYNVSNLWKRINPYWYCIQCHFTAATHFKFKRIESYEFFYQANDLYLIQTFF